jgi:hypothetical protein
MLRRGVSFTNGDGLSDGCRLRKSFRLVVLGGLGLWSRFADWLFG